MLLIYYCGMLIDLGLVLVLDVKFDVVCDGLVLWIVFEDYDSVFVMLCECELVLSVYVEYLLLVQFDIGEMVEVYIYVIDFDYE